MKLVVFMASLVLSAHLMASTKCPSDAIKGVQIKASGEVIYTTGSGVRRGVGKLDNNPVVRAMTDILLLAAEKDLLVQVAYSDNFDCDKENTQAVAEWIYIQNPTK